MPTLRTHRPLPKPWHARQRRNYVEYSLGYYSTQDDAKFVEEIFNAFAPSKRGVPYDITSMIDQDAQCQYAADFAVSCGKVLLRRSDSRGIDG